MIKKWFLFSQSTGHRGEVGRKKIYEVTLAGNQVTLQWGMAEKGLLQTQTKTFPTDNAARWFAQDKVNEKTIKGYVVAQTV